MPKTPSPITELERMIEKRKTGQGAVVNVESAPNDWLREVPSSAEVRRKTNGRAKNGENSSGNGNSSG